MLKRLWCWLVGSGCKWVTVDESPYTTHNLQGQQTSRGSLYALRCEKCGEMKFLRDMG